MPRTPPRRPSLALLGLLTGVALLAACGQPETPQPVEPGTVSVPIQPTVTPISTAPETIDPSAAGSEGLFDASANLTTTSCVATDGVWSYTGTLKNPESTGQTFTVALIIVKGSDLTPVETKELRITVPAGQTVPVEAKAFYRSPEAGLQCMTGVTVKED